MANTYTREDLEGMRRSEIRALAVSDEFGMAPKEAVSAASKDLIEFILSKQGGEGKKAASKKGALKSVPEEVVAPEEVVPEGEPEEAPAEAKPGKSSKKEENAVTGRIDKLGLALDDAEKNIKTDIAGIQQQVYVLMAMVKLMLGTTDLEPSDVDEAITKANDDFNEGK